MKSFEYAFPTNPQDSNYRLFPLNLEEDPLVYFHGTAETSLSSILKQGFQFKCTLRSISFAKTSALPLRYACEKRSESSPNGCVIAVRYCEENLSKVVLEGEFLTDFILDPQPTIIGFCVVPARYQFV